MILVCLDAIHGSFSRYEVVGCKAKRTHSAKKGIRIDFTREFVRELQTAPHHWFADDEQAAWWSQDGNEVHV